MFKVLILSIILIFIALAGFAVKILFSKLLLKKEGKFPKGSVSSIKQLRDQGIKCVKHEEMSCYKKSKDSLSTGCGCGS